MPQSAECRPPPDAREGFYWLMNHLEMSVTVAFWNGDGWAFTGNATVREPWDVHLHGWIVVEKVQELNLRSLLGRAP